MLKHVLKKAQNCFILRKSSVTLALALAYFKTGFKAVHLKKSEPCKGLVLASL